MEVGQENLTLQKKDLSAVQFVKHVLPLLDWFYTELGRIFYKTYLIIVKWDIRQCLSLFSFKEMMLMMMKIIIDSHSHTLPVRSAADWQTCGPHFATAIFYSENLTPLHFFINIKRSIILICDCFKTTKPKNEWWKYDQEPRLDRDPAAVHFGTNVQNRTPTNQTEGNNSSSVFVLWVSHVSENYRL